MNDIVSRATRLQEAIQHFEGTIQALYELVQNFNEMLDMAHQRALISDEDFIYCLTEGKFPRTVFRKQRTLTVEQTAGFSERAHRYFMGVQNDKALCLEVMNRNFPWWGCYRYQYVILPQEVSHG